MSRHAHDHFAKALLCDCLGPLGDVRTQSPVHAEQRTVDVLFHSRRARPGWRQRLGGLGRMALGWTAFEAYRNAVSRHAIHACMNKVGDLHADLHRLARREKRPPGSVKRPTLWMITPTLSPELRRDFAFAPMKGWPPGFFQVGRRWGLMAVVVHELPVEPSTLFLRVYGRGKVQQGAFAEIDALPLRHPLRMPALLRMVSFTKELRLGPGSQPDRHKEPFVKRLTSLHQWEQEVHGRGKAEGRAEGKAEGVLAVLEVRGLKVSPPLRKRVLACREPKRLDHLLRRAVVVDSAPELFP